MLNTAMIAITSSSTLLVSDAKEEEEADDDKVSAAASSSCTSTNGSIRSPNSSSSSSSRRRPYFSFSRCILFQEHHPQPQQPQPALKCSLGYESKRMRRNATKKSRYSININKSGSSSSTCTSSSRLKERSSSSLRPRQSRVRFELDDDESDQVKTQVFEYKAPTRKEKALLYTGGEEGYIQKRKAILEAIKYRLSNTKYVETLEMLLYSPLECNPGAHVATTMKTTTENNDSNSESEEEGNLAFLRILGGCGSDEVRGLEIRMSKLLKRHQQWTTNAILCRQAELLENKKTHKQQQEQEQRKQDTRIRPNNKICQDDESFHPALPSEAEDQQKEEEQDELLRWYCEKVNQSTRDLARKLAIADEIEARKVYDEKDGDDELVLLLASADNWTSCTTGSSSQ